MFAEVDERYGRLDVLVNNAGISEGAAGESKRLNDQSDAIRADAAGGGVRSAHWDITPHVTDESWARMIGVHLSGTFYCCRAAIPLLVRGDGAAIVNLSSIGAIRGGAGFPHYSAAKAGVLGLTRSLAAELGSRNVRVNAILPGTVDTPMSRAYSDAWWKIVMASQPISRMAQPREIAMTALFLASDDGAFYTGQALSPNGGVVMFS
jgi:3-oxoacyl-[acyl-carrier protein] reductase